MSRLDQLICYIDELDKKSDNLIDSIYDSTDIIQRISHLGLKSIEIDNDLDNLRSIIWNNSKSLQQYHELKEKTELINNNFEVNDLYTNQTNFENLTLEYHQVLKNLQINDDYCQENKQQQCQNVQQQEQKVGNANSNNVAISDIETPQSMASQNFTSITTPTLSNKLSLSNLKLKPIRCNSKKIYKKKSSYRLSSIYNINPIAYDELYSPDASSNSFNSPNNDDDNNNHDDKNDNNNNNNCNSNNFTKFTPVNDNEKLYQNDKFDSPFMTPKKLIEYDNISTEISQDENNNFENYHDDSTITTFDNHPIYNPKSRNRSNSLPEPTKSTVFSSYGLMKSSNIFSQYELENLRNTRLQHFISERDLQSHSDKPVNFDNDLLLNDLNIQDVDEISIFSDEENQIDNENDYDFNFDSYLRQSRNNLLENFPNIPQKASSHDSILSKPTITVASSFKFNNPGNSIKLSTPTVQPTLANLDTGTIQMKDIKRKSSNIKDDPKIILSDFITRNNKSVQKSNFSEVPKTPKPSLIDMFQFNNTSSTINTPTKGDSQPIRRYSTTGSIDLWANNLLHLVHSSKEEIPEKIRELKSQSLTKPISVKNDIQNKRKPIRIPGSQSRLVIGQRNTKIIHGESSPFRRPIVSKVSRISLHEALSQSMM